MSMTDGCCRACGTAFTQSFVDLGLSPLANSYVPVAGTRRGEMFHPLHAFVCKQCFLVQLEEFETPEQIFSDYAYFSSFSTSWLEHAENYANTMSSRFQLGRDSKVVEVASNDGYLLQYFVALGIPVRGVEPAANVAKTAVAKNVPTSVMFFGEAAAETLRAEGHASDLMAANNVLAHVPDILDFVAGFRVLLKPDGVATFEFPHLLRMIQHRQFDTIYHEHFSYLSLGVVQDIARRNGLRVFDVEHLPTHGGSLRVFVCHDASGHETTPAVASALLEEQAAHLTDLSGYENFSEKVLAIKSDALSFLIAAQRDGKSVVGYGAAAKGNTFLNYCGIGPGYISAVADRSPHKQGTLLPGSRIPVVSPETILSMKPDFVFILPWNIKDEVAKQLSAVRAWGGRFVTAIPELAIF